MVSNSVLRWSIKTTNDTREHQNARSSQETWRRSEQSQSTTTWTSCAWAIGEWDKEADSLPQVGAAPSWALIEQIALILPLLSLSHQVSKDHAVWNWSVGRHASAPTNPIYSNIPVCTAYYLQYQHIIMNDPPTNQARARPGSRGIGHNHTYLQSCMVFGETSFCAFCSLCLSRNDDTRSSNGTSRKVLSTIYFPVIFRTRLNTALQTRWDI